MGPAAGVTEQTDAGRAPVAGREVPGPGSPAGSAVGGRGQGRLGAAQQWGPGLALSLAAPSGLPAGSDKEALLRLPWRTRQGAVRGLAEATWLGRWQQDESPAP